MSWTDERVELLKKLWADGLSASQIATKLGEVTRNAVIGKVHRLGLAGRATTSRIRTARPRSNIALFPARSAQMQYRTFGNTALKEAPQERRAAAVIPLRALPDLDPAPEGLITLIDLKETMCHWPIGDPMEEGFHFCGRRKGFGSPYCEHHSAIAYNPTARRRAS
ncbi:MAG: GcrA cell cycle regulator [Rhodomicrobium sp.]|jgi:GcrA cell cycle regulator|nr:GcrA cell cycle regulator [Rhodomicrobium sp.]